MWPTCVVPGSNWQNMPPRPTPLAHRLVHLNVKIFNRLKISICQNFGVKRFKMDFNHNFKWVTISTYRWSDQFSKLSANEKHPLWFFFRKMMLFQISTLTILRYMLDREARYAILCKIIRLEMNQKQLQDRTLIRDLPLYAASTACTVSNESQKMWCVRFGVAFFTLLVTLFAQCAIQNPHGFFLKSPMMLQMMKLCSWCPFM